MSLILNVIVLIMEVLYYSLFMKFAKSEGKFWKYLLLFSLISIFFFFVGTNQIYSYLLLIIMILYGIKFIVKIKISLYDAMFLFIMLLFKHIIEIPFSLLLYIFIKNIYIVTILVGFIKVIITLNLKEKINKIYSKISKLWNNNNFYIRYIFTTFMLLYTIVSCLYCIVKWM